MSDEDRLHQMIYSFSAEFANIYKIGIEAYALARQIYISSSKEIVVHENNKSGSGATLKIDFDVEQIIIEELSKNYTILTEEQGSINKSNCDKFAIIDPIDGSDVAIRDLDFFSICIAVGVIENKNILLNNINFALIINSFGIYWAIKEQGAYKGTKRIKTNNLSNISNCIARIPQKIRLNPYVLDSCSAYIYLGSTATELCLLAEGKIDVYLEAKNRKIFDYASAYLLITESNGLVNDLHGNNISCIPIDLFSTSTLSITSNKILMELVQNEITEKNS